MRACLDGAWQAAAGPGSDRDLRPMKSCSWDCLPMPGRFSVLQANMPSDWTLGYSGSESLEMEKMASRGRRSHPTDACHILFFCFGLNRNTLNKINDLIFW